MTRWSAARSLAVASAAGHSDVHMRMQIERLAASRMAQVCTALYITLLVLMRLVSSQKAVDVACQNILDLCDSRSFQSSTSTQIHNCACGSDLCPDTPYADGYDGYFFTPAPLCPRGTKLFHYEDATTTGGSNIAGNTIYSCTEGCAYPDGTSSFGTDRQDVTTENAVRPPSSSTTDPPPARQATAPTSSTTAAAAPTLSATAPATGATASMSNSASAPDAGLNVPVGSENACAYVMALLVGCGGLVLTLV